MQFRELTNVSAPATRVCSKITWNQLAVINELAYDQGDECDEGEWDLLRANRRVSEYARNEQQIGEQAEKVGDSLRTKDELWREIGSLHIFA